MCKRTRTTSTALTAAMVDTSSTATVRIHDFILALRPAGRAGPEMEEALIEEAAKTDGLRRTCILTCASRWEEEAWKQANGAMFGLRLLLDAAPSLSRVPPRAELPMAQQRLPHWRWRMYPFLSCNTPILQYLTTSSKQNAGKASWQYYGAALQKVQR